MSETETLFPPPPAWAPEPAPVRCASCGVELPGLRRLWVGDHWACPRVGCSRCVPVSDESRIARRATIVPAHMRDTDPDRLPQEIMDAWLGWDDRHGHRGIGIVGPVGLGKSRCLRVGLMWIGQEGRRVETFTAAQLAGRVTDNAEWWQLARPDILGLDDLGTVAMSPRTQERCYEAVEARVARGKPTCWTADIDGARSGQWSSLAKLLKKHSDVWAWSERNRRFER